MKLDNIALFGDESLGEALAHQFEGHSLGKGMLAAGLREWARRGLSLAKIPASPDEEDPWGRFDAVAEHAPLLLAGLTQQGQLGWAQTSFSLLARSGAKAQRLKAPSSLGPEGCDMAHAMMLSRRNDYGGYDFDFEQRRFAHWAKKALSMDPAGRASALAGAAWAFDQQEPKLEELAWSGSGLSDFRQDLVSMKDVAAGALDSDGEELAERLLTAVDRQQARRDLRQPWIRAALSAVGSDCPALLGAILPALTAADPDALARPLADLDDADDADWGPWQEAPQARKPKTLLDLALESGAHACALELLGSGRSFAWTPKAIDAAFSALRSGLPDAKRQSKIQAEALAKASGGAASPADRSEAVFVALSIRIAKDLAADGQTLDAARATVEAAARKGPRKSTGKSSSEFESLLLLQAVELAALGGQPKPKAPKKAASRL